MKFSQLRIFLFIFIQIVALFVFSASLKSLIEGPPQHIDILTKESFVPVFIEKLDSKQVNLLYLNMDWLRKNGIEGSEKELRKEALDVFSWMATDKETPHKAYADKYGGSGMGGNLGSGRAAVLGKIQIKGLGVTPLYIEIRTAYAEEKGVMTFKEGLYEAIWGNILANELPYGATRVIAIIDTGLKSEDGSPKVLVIREAPLRAGHFIAKDLCLSDCRIKKIQKNFNKALPFSSKRENYLLKLVKEKKKTFRLTQANKDFISSSDEWLYRSAKQVASAYAKRFYHGAHSQSNISIDGAYLDYETFSKNTGFGRIRVLSLADSFGSFDEIKRSWGSGFIDRLEKAQDLKIGSPVNNTWKHYLNTFLQQEMLTLFGFPDFVFDKIKNEEAFIKFGKLIYEASQIANENRTINLHTKYMPKYTGKFDFSTFIVDLAYFSEDPDSLKELINKNKFFKKSFKKDLLKSWIELYNISSGAFYKKYDKSDISFSRLIYEKAYWLAYDSNRVSEFISSEIEEIQNKYKKNKNGKLVQSEIDKIVFESVKDIRGLKPHQVIESISYNERSKKSQVNFYDFLKDKSTRGVLGVESSKVHIKLSCRSLFVQ